MDLHFGIFLQQEARTKQNFFVTVDFIQNYMHFCNCWEKVKLGEVIPQLRQGV